MTNYYVFENTPLPYAYDALEPHIDTKTMELHHDRHLQTYIDNLNAALKDYPRLQDLSLEQLIRIAGRLPGSIGIPIARNAGGVYNHRLFFNGMSPNANGYYSGSLADAIDRTFDSKESFEEKFRAAALSVFGSGYAWLVTDRHGNLRIITTANQDTPLTMGFCPIITIDVWEHAYYLKHYNKRADYISDWYHVANWQKADDNYIECVFMPLARDGFRDVF